ncbi:cytochrome c [Microbaculum marinum]|uniref:Cytochrome c n=1 Tax=Microbaculum marinum TaxID=1764581 RepID=A0AAW9RRL0_9HYPH
MIRQVGFAAGAFAALLGCAAQAADDPEAGHALVEQRCAGCHAIEATGESPNPDAPPFRTFKSKWPLENLEEALAEGIVVGHEGQEMPEFTFEPEQISDIIAYLDRVGDS